MGLLGLLLAAAGATAAVPPSPPNLVLVTIDTLRADHLHAYGNAKIETAVTDRLAREGVLLEDAVVQVPQTRPSHACLLTGRLPYEHGIRDNYSPPLDPRLPTLATVLKGRGYRTAAFIGSYALASISGLNRGFDVYDEPFSDPGGGKAMYTRPERPASEVIDDALGWLRKAGAAPLFLWVHLYDPHAPYAPPPPYDTRYAGRLYDGEIAYADAQLGRLVELLEQRGLRGRTLLVVTSDHGEGLGDHGEDEHLMFVYDTTLHVPLIASWPGVLPAGARLPGLFRSVDLLPTVLDLLGVPAVASSGASRAAELRAGRRLPDGDSYAESLFGSLHFGYAPLRALRAEGWKLIDAPRPELYNLKDDPGETRNMIELRGPVATQIRERLKAYDKTADRPPALAAPDAGTMERLTALGYVGGGGGPRGASGGADPKDKIQDYQSYSRDMQRAIALYGDGQLDGALALLTRLSRADTASLEVAYFLGKTQLRKKRYAEAAKAFEEALALVPRWTPIYADLSMAYARLGRTSDAREVLERGLRLDPTNAALLGAKGALLYATHDLPGARAALEKARGLNPKDAPLRLALSAVYRDLGDRERAIAELREGARLDPGDADVWNALGLLLGESGQERGARESFEAALKARPGDPDASYNLARAYLKAERPQEALRLLEPVVAKAPDFADAVQALEEARQRTQPLGSGQIELRLMRLASRAAAEDALKKLAAGREFAALARSGSIDPSAAAGGQLGVLRAEDLGEPLRSAAAALAVGQLSPILETPHGFVLLKRER